MNDKQKNTAAIGGARTKGCRIKPEERHNDVSADSGKQRLTLVHSSEAVNSVGLSSDAETELRELIGSLLERRVEPADEDDLPPAA
jgi:hypothetical protein